MMLAWALWLAIQLLGWLRWGWQSLSEPILWRETGFRLPRRRRETVGDIDLLVIAKDAESVMQHFVTYPKLAHVEMAGDTRGRVALQSGLEVDLRILPRKSYGAALVYFTGSKEHNIRLRKRAIERDLRLSEYGVFREHDESADDGERDAWAGEMVSGGEESEVYGVVDLPWIAP